ncbi:helix-turn-helix domain-containing protein [Microbacterium sp. ASV81]
MFAREYEEGITLAKLVDRHHISYGVIRRALIDAGVQMRARGGRTV